MQWPDGHALREKIKVPPVASAGPRSGQNPALSTHMTPPKPTPPRPEGPEHHRFKRDVVTRFLSRCQWCCGRLGVHARKRLTALTRRYSPSAARGLDVLTPIAQTGYFMAVSGYGFTGKGLGKAEPIKLKRLMPVTATLTLCAPVKGICRLTCPPGIRARTANTLVSADTECLTTDNDG